MSNVILTLIGLAVIAFLLAVIAALFTGPIMAIPAEGFSRASTNLALLAIAFALLPRRGAKAA